MPKLTKRRSNKPSYLFSGVSSKRLIVEKGNFSLNTSFIPVDPGDLQDKAKPFYPEKTR